MKMKRIWHNFIGWVIKKYLEYDTSESFERKQTKRFLIELINFCRNI